MNVLKIATAGSVDDGKSTLIGRLLYDTQSLTTDKLAAIEKSSKQKGYDYLDFSLATDGLIAEREQGITIDVAHIYFSTPNRSYIIADTPGHIEYTRNMVTGASTAKASIILIDARKGVIEQTKRHFSINNLLRVEEVIVAVNKMDLMNYSESVFEEIKADFNALIAREEVHIKQITFIPVSALFGDNVASSSDQMPWYTGDTLLHHLEKINPDKAEKNAPFRFNVQTVIRPKSAQFHDFRGYAGQVAGSTLEVGDELMVYPSETKSTVKEIHFFDAQYTKVHPGASVVITLADELNISRGDLITKVNQAPKVEKSATATVCWMDSTPMSPQNKYLIQHGTHEVTCKAMEITPQNFGGIEHQNMENGLLKINQIGTVSFKTNAALYYDTYAENKSNGRFIIIDPKTNNTSGVGFFN